MSFRTISETKSQSNKVSKSRKARTGGAPVNSMPPGVSELAAAC